jgi:hypothetical protein
LYRYDWAIVHVHSDAVRDEYLRERETTDE